jgi:hypothetical protein
MVSTGESVLDGSPRHYEPAGAWFTWRPRREMRLNQRKLRTFADQPSAMPRRGQPWPVAGIAEGAGMIGRPKLARPPATILPRSSVGLVVEFAARPAIGRTRTRNIAVALHVLLVRHACTSAA